MSSLTKQRIEAIDQFRGFAIICMVLINYGMSIQTMPAWLEHAPDIGLTFPDLGAPAFIFAIGLTFGLSYHRRVEENGLPATIGHFMRRYLAILGMGAIIAAGETLLGRNTSGVDWGVLQAIGCAGILTLAVIQLPMGVRLGFGLGLLTLYQLLLDRYWLETVLRSPHGGLIGALSWSALLIIATVFGDLYHSPARRRYFPAVSLLFLIAGLFSAIFVPVSKNRVSASYVLITLAASGLIFSLFYLSQIQLNYFSAWGRNPILLYGLSFLLTGLFVLPDIPSWHLYAPLWLVILQALALVLIMGSVALYWQKKGFIFSM
ncbi:MAG: heparan-alpha-glucosaminide N-acetyltransferase domain-containing protein [Anaerolineales bacterium]|jgi:predicted acyltransferase